MGASRQCACEPRGVLCGRTNHVDWSLAMSLVRRRNMNEVPGRVGWWTLLLVVLVYVAFSLQMGVAELLFLFGVGAEVKHRATPVVFVVHALAGAVCLA